MNLNRLKKLNEELNKILTEGTYFNYVPDADDLMADLSFDTSDYKGSFAEWFGKDLTGQTYEGDLYCVDKGLKNLKGAPKIVTGTFDCSNNNLTSLEGAPQEVGRDFACIDNKLTSLEGAPQKVGRDFYCDASLHSEARKMGYSIW